MQKNMTARRRQAEETKRHIFDTALKLLDERGFEEITVRDIVREAKVSIGSFYNYYTSKLDVFYETYRLADEYFESVVAPEVGDKPFETAMYLYFDYYARYSSEITSLALTKVLYNSKNKCFERKSETGMHRVLCSIIRKGIEDKKLTGEDTPEETAHFFLVAVRGQIYNWCTNDGEYDLREAVKKQLSRLLRAYR